MSNALSESVARRVDPRRECAVLIVAHATDRRFGPSGRSCHVEGNTWFPMAGTGRVGVLSSARAASKTAVPATPPASDRLQRQAGPIQGRDTAQRLQPVSVLLIDDEPAILRLISSTLGAVGCSVITARTAQAGRALAESHHADLFLIDLVLPDGNGLDLARDCLRARPEVPFILVSGHLTDEITVRAMRLGAADVIAKPFSQDALVARVRRALNRAEKHGVEWEPLDADLSNPDRWARLVFRVGVAARDPRTITELARVVGVSAAAFRQACTLVGVKPHDARDLARLLRAVRRSGGQRGRIEAQLRVRDLRTMERLVARSTLPTLASQARISLTEFLLAQRFVAIDNPGLQALLEIVAREL